MLKNYLIKPGHRLHWKHVDPDDKGPFSKKEDAVDETVSAIETVAELQERLYAEGRQALLIVLQAMDAGGKDGTIRQVMKGVNPQSCRVTSFKVPTPEERAHDFLWRVHKEVPAKGTIGIFNRSHYEDVLVPLVHESIGGKELERRYREINDFERLLVKNGTTILKFHLAISKDEQRERLQARLDDPAKRWKFNINDLAERRLWSRYRDAYAEAISATSTKHAPWYVIPADHKWYRNYLVATLVAATLKDMNPRFPPAPKGVNFKKIQIPE